MRWALISAAIVAVGLASGPAFAAGSGKVPKPPDVSAIHAEFRRPVTYYSASIRGDTGERAWRWTNSNSCGDTRTAPIRVTPVTIFNRARVRASPFTRRDQARRGGQVLAVRRPLFRLGARNGA
jgi:hypothetical protein